MDIQEAEKIINKRTERLLEEFKIEKEVEPQDEPKIAYLMQEIRANKTILSELEKKDKTINLMAEIIEECRQNDCLESDEIDLSEIAGKDKIIDYFTNKVEEDK